MQYLVHPVIEKSTNRPGSEANKGRYYALVALQTGMVAGLQAGGKLEQQAWSASTRQMFRVIPAGTGHLSTTTSIPAVSEAPIYELEVVGSGKVLGLETTAKNDGLRIVEQARTGAATQRFFIRHKGDGQFMLINSHSQKAMDLQNYKDGEGGVIYQYTQHGKNNQRWLFSEIVLDRAYEDLTATIYENPGYDGRSQSLGVGSYTRDQLALPNDSISSVRVPAPLRVTLWDDDQFKGGRKILDGDTSNLYGHDNRASSVIVERVITVYSGAGFTGDAWSVGVGGYVAVELQNHWIGNDRIKSIKVPPGMLVVAFEHDLYKGNHIILFGDEPSLPDGWANRISSLIVKQTGVIVPAHAVRYGGKLTLMSTGLLIARNSGGLDTTNQINIGEDDARTFTIERSGATTLRSHVCYGDIVSLKSTYGKYVVAENDGQANANRDRIGEWEKFRIVRAGNTTADSFVSEGDTIALESVPHKKYLGSSGSQGPARASAKAVGEWERWRIGQYRPPNHPADGKGPVARTARTTNAPPSPCGANVCVAEACLADACGAAACGAAAAFVSACGAAASGIAVCGVDVGAVAVGGIAACVAATVGVAACGADVCGAAACGAAACAAAACGAAACGADACGAAASILSACGANAGGLDMCGADACGANACGINLCGADACAADACGVDLIPVVPLI